MGMAQSCPICGAKIRKGEEGFAVPGRGAVVPQHRCRKRVIDGIDAATDQGEHPPRTPGLSERLTDGFRILHGGN